MTIVRRFRIARSLCSRGVPRAENDKAPMEASAQQAPTIREN